MRNPIFDEEVIPRRERLWRFVNTEIPPLRGGLVLVLALLLQWVSGYLYLYCVCRDFAEMPVEACPATNEGTCLKAVTADLVKKTSH